MAVGKNTLLVHSIIAAATITQYRAVTGAGAVPAAGGRILGVAAVGAASGERLPVDIEGTTIAESGAAVAVDAALEVDSLGRFITKSTGVAVARALSSASGAGQQMEVLLIAN